MRLTASQKETRVALEIIIALQANDCRANHCKPTAEQSASIAIVLVAKRNTPVSVSGKTAVRQITETGLDLGDYLDLFLPNELELKHQREAEVVLAKLGPAVGRKRVERETARRIKTDRAQIDEFILAANAPVRGQSVLHTTAKVPAKIVVRFLVSGQIETGAGCVHVMQSGLVRDVAKRATASEVRQPVSDRITNPTAEGREIIRVESLLNALVARSGHDESAAVEGIARPQGAAIAFNAEYPATHLEVVTNESAGLTAIGVQIVRRMRSDSPGIIRQKQPRISPLKSRVDDGFFIAAECTDVEAGPVKAFWCGSRRNLLHFFSAWQRLGACKRCQSERERGARSDS